MVLFRLCWACYRLGAAAGVDQGTAATTVAVDSAICRDRNRRDSLLYRQRTITLFGLHPRDDMQNLPTTPPECLREGVARLIQSPLKTIAPPWSWKAATCNAVVRALAFFATNLQSGREQATKAMLVEVVFALFAGGLIGAVSQYLRRARPLWATALLLCVMLPGAMIVAQGGVHRLANTQHQSSGVLVSSCLGVFVATYTWYAMRRGAMLGGTEQTTVRHDLHSLPRISLDFLLSVPRFVVTRWRHERPVR